MNSRLFYFKIRINKYPINIYIMKKYILIVLFSLFSNIAFSEDEFGGYLTHNISLLVGAGLATQNNYDVGPSLALSFHKACFKQRVFLGISLNYQEYSLYYDREAQALNNEKAYEGVTIRNKSDYGFFSPSIEYYIGNSCNFSLYVNGGVGYSIGGTETLHKWDQSHSYPLTPTNAYDSTINTTSNINKLIFRYAIGMCQYSPIYGRHPKKIKFMFNEEIGFVQGNISTTANNNNPSRTTFSPNNLSPVYITFRIGYYIW